MIATTTMKVIIMSVLLILIELSTMLFYKYIVTGWQDTSSGRIAVDVLWTTYYGGINKSRC